MTVCLDTGVFLQMFGRRQPFYRILRALLDGSIILAVSTEILLEYEEITVQCGRVGVVLPHFTFDLAFTHFAGT
jgi:hypothetical protein